MKMIDVYEMAERMNVKVMKVGSKIVIDEMNWRKEPITEKQEKLIAEMCEMSEFPLEQFTGTTKGEASDWIDRNMKKAHETIDQYEATHA